MSAATTSAPTRATKALSVLDMAFFMLESRERMSNVGPLAILQPPPRTRSARAFADRLMKQMKARPVGAPFNLRYRPIGLQGLPCLEAVDAVDLDWHCHRLSLPAPGTDAQLFEMVCRLHEKRLDRSRPPWEFYLIDGLERGRIAIYAKVHHGLIDGRGFVEICTRWFSPEPADLQTRALWEGLPVRRARAGAARQTTAVAARTNPLGRSARTAASLWSALARQVLASAKILPGMSLPFVGTPGALRAKPSMQRSFACCVLPLAQMKSFGKAHGFGLPERRYLAGAEIEIALPVSVLAPGQSLNVTAVTYDQGLQLGFIALAAQVPDVQRLADFTAEAFNSLVQAGAPRPPRSGRAKGKAPSP